MKELTHWELNPIPRGATYRKWDNFLISPRILYAHQLFYVFNGTGFGAINGETFPLEPGLLVIYGPGCLHEFSSIHCGGLEMGMICFSLNETNQEKLNLGNKYVTAIDDNYWDLADEPVHVAGLPLFPFRTKLEKTWSLAFENNLRATGDAWRRHFSETFVYEAKSILNDLFFHLEMDSQEKHLPPMPPCLKYIADFISENYGENINRHTVARKFHISESYLTTIFKKHMNTNFTDFLEQKRLQAAMELIQYSELSTKEIASKVGFNSFSYFITRFNRKYGITPGKLR